MRFLSIDLETSGLNPKRDHILEFTAIVYDTGVHGLDYSKINFEELPTFYRKIFYTKTELDSFIDKTSKAYEMNKDLIDYLYQDHKLVPYCYCEESKVSSEFKRFLLNNKFDPMDVTVCGKNFNTFDKLFLEELPKFNSYIHFKHRTLDPAIFFLDLSSDEEVPSLQTCIDKSTFKFGETVTSDLKGYLVKHTSYDDALVTLKLLLLNLLNR